MNLIEHVRYEMRRLSESAKALRNFGLTMAAVFAILAVYVFFIHHLDTLAGILLLFTMLFFVLASLDPIALVKVRRYWMALAFTLGWFVSRLFLIVFFYIVLTPISLIARIAGKKFLQTYRTGQLDTYWVKRSTEASIDHTKMY